MQLWEKATEPLRPLGAPTHLESGFFALSVGLGEAGGGRKKKHTHTHTEAPLVSAPAQLRHPRAARSSDLVNTLKNKDAVKATREPL